MPRFVQKEQEQASQTIPRWSAPGHQRDQVREPQTIPGPGYSQTSRCHHQMHWLERARFQINHPSGLELVRQTVPEPVLQTIPQKERVPQRVHPTETVHQRRRVRELQTHLVLVHQMLMAPGLQRHLVPVPVQTSRHRWVVGQMLQWQGREPIRMRKQEVNRISLQQEPGRIQRY